MPRRLASRRTCKRALLGTATVGIYCLDATLLAAVGLVGTHEVLASTHDARPLGMKVDQDPWLALLFLFPLNLALIGAIVGDRWRPAADRVRPTAAARFTPVSLPSSLRSSLRISLPRLPTAVFISSTILITSYLALVVVVLAAWITGSTSPLLILVCSSLALGVIATVLVTRLWRVARGDFDLAIDPVARTVSIPATFGRRIPVRIPAGQVRGFCVDVVDGHRIDIDDKSTPRYQPTLVWTDGQAIHRATLASWPVWERAAGLVDFLRGRFVDLETRPGA